MKNDGENDEELLFLELQLWERPSELTSKQWIQKHKNPISLISTYILHKTTYFEKDKIPYKLKMGFCSLNWTAIASDWWFCVIRGNFIIERQRWNWMNFIKCLFW